MSNPDVESVVAGTWLRVIGETMVGQVGEPASMQEMHLAKLLSGRAIYHVQDSFITVAALVTTEGEYMASGASKRNPIDKPNGLRGRALALSRAVRNYIQTNNLVK